MRIGILQTGHAPDDLMEATGDYDAMFRRLLAGNGFDFDTYAVVDGDFPENAGSADGWLITGSKHGAYDDLPWIAPLERLIRAIRDSGRPLVGICFGHQIIAQALGGRVEKFAGGWSVGATDYDRGDERLTLNAWHQDQVTALPDGAQVIAGNDFCANAILAYGDTIWTVQPHPEFGSDFIDGLLRTRAKGVVPETIQARAAARLDIPTDSRRITDEIAAFFMKERA
ncbi:type 1 glutamine amidotransferase [Pukyongiella litopenaei]|uniref:Type 1 glutamine amidotransferase n=1 Tax=Pukyongiella litopenaei TaxID=2605946 RepID=A0A2S0MU89_9RHOB|nr:type 1 glutamine amidotransferase [Pukyongiella litopenaei]AVO39459.1 type 1 glutamine amidotransferase [Pukyongiella litopenaei]